MPFIPANMQECGAKKRCLVGTNIGLAYTPGKECLCNETFNPAICDCEPCLDCDAYKTYYAVYKRYISTSGCSDTSGPADRAAFAPLITGSVSGTEYITYTFEFVRDEPIPGGLVRTVWQPVATIEDLCTGQSTVSWGQTITTSGDQPSVVSIIGDQVQCFQQEPACREDPVITVCYNSQQQQV